ncbi:MULTISPECIES: DUF1684 domain-containing protein [Bifidobacterium]|jgi:uncharacterized protein (DUF1684 family)|uniref:DUF1684 domain-containing protein n=1 Tax=Bifidobacterium TaxID=1678 RepID=UPI002352646C|nr:DUF1684 domain-containing protein [Bifidobacterium tibiigranuli]MCH3975766.1 DUF1684 domain-containing protein [Bifidobacterium tibiigranuli]MCH4189314.1 DUF1684 domain-containing protein [Bifidobacterium tibiigranuli]MCH4203051.1 DUF1684 domain-containing protein [Bifidobacterium tibiigranuli]MCH4274800.1 DUF1684 domain-containing protein [Bifidobacterium tibiigranuli]MCI1211679.1 DUF1684 domain-containing protein [Bifidobacterium tibiigranuli]
MTTYQDIQNLSDDEYTALWNKLYKAREAQLNSEYGWLSLRSIDWLSDNATITIDGFPGQWTQQGNTVIYTPEPGKDVVNHGEVLTEPKEITVDITADVNVEDFDYEGVRAQLIKRIGSSRTFAVRQRDPNSITRQRFTGIPHFKPDKRWVVPARYVPLPQWENVETSAVLGDLSHNETAIGDLYVEVNGKEHRIVVLQGHNDDSAWIKVDEKTGKKVYLDNRQNTKDYGFILLRDATSGKETYGGGRALHLDFTDPDGITYLDFNQTGNLPCAFTYFCTCPFAPEENNFDFAITAGEKTPTIIDTPAE